MDDLVSGRDNLPAVLDGYVQQANMFLYNAQQNLLQFGRVLTEVKPLLPHGEFTKWVKEHFGLEPRSAQNYMAVWEKFGNNVKFQNVKFSSLQKMLSLPEGREEAFAAENDLENMTSRQVAEAVRKVRDQLNGELDREREARRNAEERAKRIAEQQKGPDPVMAAAIKQKNEEIEKYRAQAEHFRAEAEVSLNGQRMAVKEMHDAQKELREAEESLSEMQKEYNRMQGELLAAQSTIARGDADRIVGDQLTIEDFSSAVRSFMGAVSQMPHMGGTFSQITSGQTIRQWTELLDTVKDWENRARKALGTVAQRGDVLDG